MELAFAFDSNPQSTTHHREALSSSRLLGAMRDRCSAIVALSHQPVDNPQHKCNGSQPEQLLAAYGAEVEDDEFARHREQGDQQHHFGLDDALFALHYVLQSMVEL